MVAEIPAGLGSWEITYCLQPQTGKVILTLMRYKLEGFSDNVPEYSDDMLPVLGAKLRTKFTELVTEHHKQIK